MKRMSGELRSKVDYAIRLLRAIPADGGPVEVAYSGGKDSDVILELARMAGIDFRAIYKNTTIDPPGTVKHCKERGVEVLMPKVSFFDLVKKKGCPSRFSRFCCEALKEYKVLDRVVLGVRRQESARRAKRYREPEVCRDYGKGQRVKQYLPILDWTADDVAEFIEARGVRCHPLYYDEQGRFRPERRLGCIGCPLKSKRQRAEEFRRYPGVLRRTIECEQVFFDTHRRGGVAARHKDAAGRMFEALFCDSYEQFVTLTGGGLFPEHAIDPRRFLEDFFEIELKI